MMAGKILILSAVKVFLYLLLQQYTFEHSETKLINTSQNMATILHSINFGEMGKFWLTLDMCPSLCRPYIDSLIFCWAAAARRSQSVDWATPESWIGTWSLDTVWSLIPYSSFASLSGDSIRLFHEKYNASTFHQRKYEKEPANRKRTEGEY